MLCPILFSRSIISKLQHSIQKVASYIYKHVYLWIHFITTSTTWTVNLRSASIYHTYMCKTAPSLTYNLICHHMLNCISVKKAASVNMAEMLDKIFNCSVMGNEECRNFSFFLEHFILRCHVKRRLCPGQLTNNTKVGQKLSCDPLQ